MIPTKTSIFILLLLCATSALAADQHNYVYNGTDWVPMLSTSDGRPYFDINLLNVTASNAIFNQWVKIGTGTATEELDVDGNISATQDVCIVGGNCLSTAGATGLTTFTVAGDGGASQTITEGNTITFDGINSIVTTGAATDTIQIDVVDDSIDGTELADTITLDVILAITGQDINMDSNTLYVDVSTNRVGLGTNTPAETLEVVGNQKLSGYINQTISDGNSRYFSNGCVEKVNSSGLYFIC